MYVVITPSPNLQVPCFTPPLDEQYKLVSSELLSGATIYKDKVFCTDQTINQANNNYYSVNSGEYTTENSFDNDYIIL